MNYEEFKKYVDKMNESISNKNILDTLEETIIKMKNEYLIDRLEVVLNNNLIEVKDKITNYRTILGCKISYNDLPKEISFIVRQDNDPTYEQLQQENKQLKDNWNKLKEWLNNFHKSIEFAQWEIVNKMQELEQRSDSNE